MAAKGLFLVDTSIAVASIVEDHEGHEAALAALEGRRVGLAGHAWFETFSVLTRLPGHARRGPDAIAQILDQNFPDTRWLPEADASRLARSLAGLGISGGSVYDALVAMTAIAHKLVLISRDTRAGSTYAALGATIEMITP